MYYRNRGIVYYFVKQYERAIADYEQAILLDPHYAEAYTNRALAYYAMKQYELANADFDKAIQIDPQDAEAYFNRGNAYGGGESNMRVLLPITDQSIQIDPRYVDAYNSRGNTYVSLKQYDRAIRDYGQRHRA